VASISKRGRYWRAQIVRRGYPPQYRTFDTRAEAEAWSRAMESEMDRGIFVSRVESEKTTLAEALKRRLHSSLGYLSPRQYEERWVAAQLNKAA
jgi:transposase InsO family protein